MGISAATERHSEGEPDLRSGFTLLELLLVMTLLGTILGVGLGAFASFDPGRRAARGLVANALRQARNEAIAHRAPARVLFDPATRTITSEGTAVAGTWRFETPAMEGARGISGLAQGFPGTPLTDDGFVGKALDMDVGGRGAKVVFDLSSEPLFRVRRGFRLSCALRPKTLEAAQILDFGGVVEMSSFEDGSIGFSVVTRRVDELGRSIPGETINVRTSPGAIEAGRWSQVEVRYDGAWLSALSDGVPVAMRAETRELWDVEKPLVIGGGRSGYDGQIDDLVILVAREGETFILPSSVEFDAREPFEVRFDEGGGLDPIAHARPVEIGLKFDDGTSDGLVVQVFGTVETR
ncbi:LamG-like jellyroll fold domain-containing protein [Planctomycetes bacterium Poly30]|uniref:LamG-like jellyroll fold domain-containing protein n=1 Tax=Saltatorellus ferox TaxID=2528018 RepID=UPI0011A69757